MSRSRTIPAYRRRSAETVRQIRHPLFGHTIPSADRYPLQIHLQISAQLQKTPPRLSAGRRICRHSATDSRHHGKIHPVLRGFCCYPAVRRICHSYSIGSVDRQTEIYLRHSVGIRRNVAPPLRNLCPAVRLQPLRTNEELSGPKTIPASHQTV